MNEFLSYIRNAFAEATGYSRNSKKLIIDPLFDKVKKDKRLFIHDDLDDDLDDVYNLENTPNFISRIYIGNIYIFLYNPEKAFKIVTLEKTVFYNDRIPLLLVLKCDKDTISGINLNLCNARTRTIILNEIQNLDNLYNENTFKNKNRENPFLNNFNKLVTTEKGRSDFLNYIKAKYKLKSLDLIYKTYSIKRILEINLIERFNWKYIPFLNYKTTISRSNTKLIRNIIG